MRCVVGIDSGGSYTRVLCVGLDGRILGRGRNAGGSPTHNVDARQHVRAALTEALAAARVEARDVVGLASGMAGFESDADREWAADFVGVEGLDCPLHLVNDSVVAHAGAFAGGPGIMVVAGTGSMILAITESGEHIRNERYHHYAGGARHLAFDAVARVLIDEDTTEDGGFVGELLSFWDVPDKAGLRDRVAAMESADRNEVKHFYGRIAPLVTGWAEDSPLASAACRKLARATAVGVRLLGAHFAADRVGVATEGGLAACAPFSDRLRAEAGPRYELRPARLEPVAGAALLALEAAGVPIDAALLERLEVQPPVPA
ncbi:MAG TPA: BadF/BadG/BcrA/BcrD ATPase family protein [Mycobacteriales bacterium]|nr:BadF/BadG/BcrA/BcrD ATPase family protein [Mycobacteriales bacterium]